MKYKIFTVIALLGSTAAELFGGWDTALKTLLIFMVLDWLTVSAKYSCGFSNLLDSSIIVNER